MLPKNKDSLEVSSAHNKFISNQEAIPVIRTDIFDGDDNALLAIARVDTEDVIAGSHPIALGYSQLRANVYIDQTGMIDPIHRRPDGGEHDDDDLRSLHLVGLENLRDGAAAVIASMRLIQKSVDHPAKLPIEDLFAEEFSGRELGYGSFEVSRWIARHDNTRYQLLSKAAVTNTGLAHAVEHNWGPCFAIVEPRVARTVNRSTGGAVSQVTAPRLIAEYNDVNLGIHVDLPTFAAHVGVDALRRLRITRSYEPNIFLRRSDEPR